LPSAEVFRQWRAIPKDLPPRSTVYDYFDLWSWDGTLDRRWLEISTMSGDGQVLLKVS